MKRKRNREKVGSVGWNRQKGGRKEPILLHVLLGIRGGSDLNSSQLRVVTS